MESDKEIIKNVESIERAHLRELEESGSFVFHGSSTKSETLEPRQAHNYDKDLNKTPDGEPAVFTSLSADDAIFMAITRPGRAGFTMHSNAPTEYRVTPDTWSQLTDRKGYVYVFNKEEFETLDIGSNEMVSYSPVSPIEIIEVAAQDLPSGIEVKEF